MMNNFQPMGGGLGGFGGLSAPPASSNPVLRPTTNTSAFGATGSNFGAMGGATGFGGNSNFGGAGNSSLSGLSGQQQQQQPKVDLSAFDSLLAFPKKDQQPKSSTAKTKDPFADLLG